MARVFNLCSTVDGVTLELNRGGASNYAKEVRAMQTTPAVFPSELLWRSFISSCIVIPHLALTTLCLANSTIAISPQPIDDVLINPGKGWIAYGSPGNHPASVLALCSSGYDRFEWSQIEPAEGKFNWKPIDDQIDAWKRAGKQFAFGVMCLNSSPTAAGGYTTPRWVFDAGAKFTSIDLQSLRDQYSGPSSVRIVPDFVDPIFKTKQKAFLTALAKRYDGNPNIAFIDIRSYGNWGENHMWPFGIPDISADDYRAMIQMHLDLLHHTTLELSAGSHHFDSVLDWAARQGIGIRRDGICGNSDGGECARSLGHAPAVFEFFGTYTWLKQKGWWDGHQDQDGNGFRLIDCVENGKPSYIGMSQWDDAKNLLEAEKPLVEKLANRMGYHIALKHAQFPQSLKSGAPADFKFEWKNDGVAPIYVPWRWPSHCWTIAIPSRSSCARREAILRTGPRTRRRRRRGTPPSRTRRRGNIGLQLDLFRTENRRRRLSCSPTRVETLADGTFLAGLL